MARAGINKSSLRTTIATQMGRSLRRKRISKTQKDIEKAVEYLLKSDFVTGTILAVDGGRSIY